MSGPLRYYHPGLRWEEFSDATGYAVRIESDCNDYRHAASSGRVLVTGEMRLDSAIARSLPTAARQMGLWLVGIDLRRTPSGETYCLEVNPARAVTYYEQLAGVSLGREILAALLLQPRTVHRAREGAR